MSIQARIPIKEKVYNIKNIYDAWTNSPVSRVKWTSQKGNKLTEDQFNDLLQSSMLELELPPDQQIPTEIIQNEFNHFLINTDSTLFHKKENYTIEYNPAKNSATITIMSINQGNSYSIEGFYRDNILIAGRPRHRSIFRQRRLKRTAAKSRCATRRATLRQRHPKSHCPPGRRHDTRRR